MASVSVGPVHLLTNFGVNLGLVSRQLRRVCVKSLGSGDSAVLSSDKIGFNVESVIGDREKIGFVVDGGNGKAGYDVEGKKNGESLSNDELEVLWDDGYGKSSVQEYLEAAKEMLQNDGGPPRWFCPLECGRPLKDSPTLFFLPGLDGLGLGLTLHHQALGKVFEVHCLHIPAYDRTPFEGLVKLIEETVRQEHVSAPNRPIYIVGDSFGGCLALAVAARNPCIDLVLILVNPATSFGKSQLQPLFPVLEALPNELHVTLPYLLSFVMGDPVKMALVNIENGLPPPLTMQKLSANLTALLPLLGGLADIIPKDTLLWKLKLLRAGSAYANSRLHAVKAEVLVLASGKDNMLPSRHEADRLWRTLPNCRVRYFEDNGHTLLLEDGLNLLTLIKGLQLYRRSRRHDYVADFLPPSKSEYKEVFDKRYGFIHLITSPVMFSTLQDGTIVKGLEGVPDEGPVLLVGYHMLLGVEITSLVERFLKEKGILVRGVAHPELFSSKLENSSTSMLSYFDFVKVFGALPVSATNFFRLFTKKSHVLLYPGGAREALHRKGEEYKLFWPEQPEFVRMAARFGATIVPFGVVGEDDLLEMVLDYDDLMRVPMVADYIRKTNEESTKVRSSNDGEVSKEDLFFPGVLPKVPGRFYYLFGKPIETKGREKILRDKEKANELYLQIKSDVEKLLAYLIKKREEDPYRNFFDRIVYRALSAPVDHVPTFKL